MSDYKKTCELFRSLKAERDKYTPVWKDISRYVGISVDPDYLRNYGKKAVVQMDEYVDDPTASISVNQFGDYLSGVMWGEEAVTLMPSSYVLDVAEVDEVAPWYRFASSRVLYHMNHEDAGFITGLRPYAYDQVSFGTSGMGVFRNEGFMDGRDSNAVSYMNYGIDSVVIDEGKSGSVEVIFIPHHWRVSRIISEFAMKGGEMDKAAFERLPKAVRDAWRKSNFNEIFTVVYGVFPSDMYLSSSKKGKAGARYKGVWFFDNPPTDGFLREEYYRHRPAAICRQINVRGEVYGRSYGGLLLSTIRSVNYMMAQTIEILEKMGNPALGVFSNAVFGDMVLDSSPKGLTVFNQTLMGSGAPAFPLHDVGDPTGIISFIIPYLNEKITSAFKVDALLDFNSGRDMTATESLHRYTIRGASVSGILSQQKNEFIVPVIKRTVGILEDVGELGINARTEMGAARLLSGSGKEDRIIPEAVLDVMESGRPWYDVKMNTELERLSSTEKIQNLLTVINTIGSVAMLYPQIVEAVDWYKLVSEINQLVDKNSAIMLSPNEFREKVAQAAQQQAMMMGLQAGESAAKIRKETAVADKMDAGG